MPIIRTISALAGRHPLFWMFIKYTILFTMLLLSLASKSLYSLIARESNPFFYANF